MFDPHTFHVVETLPDGVVVEIRAQRPEDREAILEEVSHASADTLYHRFFAMKRSLSEKEKSFFFNVDFVKHFVLLAVTKANDRSRIIGGARLVVTEPGKGEVAFSVVDDFQHHGLGALLMRRIAAVARDAGITELYAEVLADNASMLSVFDHSGLTTKTFRDGPTIHVTMHFREP